MAIIIDGKHSFNDYGLILSSKNIPAPKPKTKTIDIVGGDGALDLTDYFGEPRFKNRTLTFNFSKVHSSKAEYDEDISSLENELQSKVCRIVLEESPDFYFEGRIDLTPVRKKNIATITMKVDALPYRMKVAETIRSQSGSGTIILSNLRKRVVPKIKTTAETNLKFGSFNVNLSAGESVIPELELKAGETSVEITTSGNVTFTYREGGL